MEEKRARDRRREREGERDEERGNRRRRTEGEKKGDKEKKRERTTGTCSVNVFLQLHLRVDSSKRRNKEMTVRTEDWTLSRG